MPSAAQSEGPTDPSGLGAAYGQLGMFTKRSARIAIGVAGVVLDPSERVEVLVSGRYRGHDGVAILTDRRLLVINDREWRPDVEELVVAPGTTIQGWQDERFAAIVIQLPTGQTITVDQISERESAQRMAAAIRTRAGTA